MKKIIILITLIIPTALFAQQDIQTTQYMFNGMYINPAYTGSHEAINATLLAREQWVQMEGAPSSQYFSIDAPIYEKMGLGLVVAHDNIGVTDQTNVYANWAYHLKVNDRDKIAFGLRGGFNFTKSKLSNLTVWDDDDEIFMQDRATSLQPNFGTGVYYYNDKWYAGVSIPTFLSYNERRGISPTEGDSSFNDVRHYYAHAGYTFELSDKVALQPSGLLRYTHNVPLQGDINLNVLLSQVLWLGATYRTGEFNNPQGESIIGLAQVLIKKNLKLGYSHDFGLTGLNNHHTGTHEVVLSYDFVHKDRKLQHPRYF